MNPSADYSLDELSRSPLWIVTQQPTLNHFVKYLDATRAQILAHPEQEVVLQFSEAGLREVRQDFSLMIRRGEEKLHKLCNLLCYRFFNSYQLHSVVIGEVATTRERFTLMQALSTEDLYSTTDLDLGNRQLAKLQFFDGKSWSQAALVSNVVEYQPTETNIYSIHKIVSRIKAEEELWNKVVDEIFDLDSLVRKDKKLEHLSRYVKDIFGVKVVVGNANDVSRFHSALHQCVWSEDLLDKVEVPVSGETTSLSFLETKNYLGSEDRKRSGWEAMKSVVLWHDAAFEVQIQPLRNYLHERELLTKESHSSFKSKRESVRNEVATRIPLFGFYRDLLRWLFQGARGTPPEHPNVSVTLTP